MISSTSPLPDDAVWLVTGCSSGIGAALCTFVSEHGHHRLVATARKLETLNYLPDSPRLLKLALDVTSAASVEAALEKTLATFGRIDVLVNNAGYGMLGVTEAIDEKDLRALMETNFWGTLRLTRAAVKIFREENPRSGSIGGVVVQVSSMGGRVAFPGDSIYHASKWAVEGFSESMAKEMHPDWKIRFLILEPGGTKSQFSASSMVKGPSHPAYADPAMAVNQILRYFDDPKNLENWADPVLVAKALFETVGREDMPLRLATGRDAWQAIRASDEERSREMDKWKDVSTSCSESA